MCFNYLFIFNFCKELNAETKLTQFWQFYQQTEGNGRTKTTPQLEDTNRARIKTYKGRFIQQSNQNNLEERKYMLSDLK